MKKDLRNNIFRGLISWGLIGGSAYIFDFLIKNTSGAIGIKYSFLFGQFLREIVYGIFGAFFDSGLVPGVLGLIIGVLYFIYGFPKGGKK